MRVLAIAHCGGALGANRSLATTIHGLILNSIDCTVACPPDPVAESLFRGTGAQVVASDIPWNCAPKLKFAPRYRTVRAYASRLRQRLRHDRSARSAAKRILSRAGRPFDCVYTNSSMTDVGHFAGKIAGAPHVWHLREVGDLDYGMTPVYGKSKQRARLQEATVTVSISRAVRDHFAKESPSARVIYNGVVDLATLERMQEIRKKCARANRHRERLAIVGILHPAKGQADAVRAFSQLLGKRVNGCANACLSVIGPGRHAELQELIQQLGIADHVRLVGELHSARAAMMRKDFLLMCSRAEAFGRVMVEAMAAGAIVVARDSGAVREVIHDGEDGAIYGTRPQQLAECLSELSRNAPLRSRLQEGAWARVRRDFTVEQYQQRMAELFREVIGSPVEQGTVPFYSGGLRNIGTVSAVLPRAHQG